MKNIFKKISIGLIILLISISISVIKAEKRSTEKKLFMVSAYYSPLPNQSHYIKGSFEGDKRLNGNGTNGADGTPVFVGMVAAPRNYPYGTRIYIPTLGIGEIHDRGGAILAHKDYDRIDVWMGRGEEGLARALNWGMRMVEGEVYYDSSEDIRINLDYSWVNNKLPSSLVKKLKAKKLIASKSFSNPVTKKSPSVDIKDLQEALRMFGFYDGPTNGKIDKQTKDAILAFQISENIIPNKNAQGAGNVGPKTSAVLKIKSEEFNSRVIKNQNRLKRNIEALTSNIGKKDSGNKVYRLQQMLWELGYYRGELNGKYDKITIDAVYQFQKNHDVVKSEYDRGAGYFGKKTHTALIAAIGEQMKKLKEFPKKIQTWVPAKIELPKLVNLKSYTKKTERKSLLFNIDLIKESDLLTKDIDYKDRSGDVKKMQDVLIAMGYLGEGLNTGFFGNQTRVALIEFQIAKGIVKKPTDQGAGRVGPTTREVLNKI